MTVITLVFIRLGDGDVVFDLTGVDFYKREPQL